MPINALEFLNSYLGRSAIGAAAGGGGAIVYNQFTDNDINPYLVAGAGAGLGAGAKFAYSKTDELMDQYVRSNRSQNAGQAVLERYRQNAAAQPVVNVQVPENNQWVNIPQQELDILRSQSRPISQSRQIDNTLGEIRNLRGELNLINQGQNPNIRPPGILAGAAWDKQQDRAAEILARQAVRNSKYSQGSYMDNVSFTDKVF